MKRILVVLASLVVPPLLGSVPAARALGTAACTISGTITITPSAGKPAQGAWSIDPAVIDCRGLFNYHERILGPGSFRGSGTYTTASDSAGACVHQIGAGTVDYWVPTTFQDVHLVEDQAFVLAGGGRFVTPTLHGSFELLPIHGGNCVTEPVVRAFFAAQAVMVRSRPLAGVNR